ncbi:MAG: 50S ribosomal protein L25 [Gemmatimonadetes bacterium]|nr:50S ribosomal protein L25 [Gemmatimonadota bacterium]MCK5482685.1 50S ribosomal protein L25 [Gemmatimonadota bacterium]MCK5488569.1 50S ribosomal protein L25 [Gemmatimonadota bacterium]
MSEQAALQVETRHETGKGAARRIRASGKIPGNVYGHGAQPMAVQADELQFRALISRISTENTLIDLKVGDEKPKAVLIREIQRHPYRSVILHVDFFEITAGERIRVAVPVRLEGNPIGVRNGGILQVIRYELEVECLPRDIPSAFEVDISEMQIGESLHIGEIDTGDVTVIEEADLTVCMVVMPKAAPVEEEEDEEVSELEGDVEPEVITARGDDQDSEDD